MDNFFELNFWEMMLRTTISFLVLLILARLLGKKQLSQLTFFHYITGISIGSISAEIASQKETPFMDGLVALIWWTVLTLLMSYLSLKSPKIRTWIDDEPTIIIKDGEISTKSLKSSRLHMDDLLMMLREQSIFSIQDVHYAVLETNGELSVMKKVGMQEATKQDVKVPLTLPLFMPSEIISDGKIVKKNLDELDLTEDWVMKKLRKHGVDSVSDVFYAQLQTNGSLHISLRKNGI
ncbi:YetF domain-containing protein [Psychrobacillus sp. BM2]|uniref:YetF domain-containing protein n=1 Tax=Psychrobacillus sp. BM2 TaxID=3400421 RepID=UPI003B01DC47